MRFALLFLYFVFMIEQSGAANLQPRCGGTFNLCGFVDLATKKEVIPFIFEQTRRFSGDRAAVRINGRWGYINNTGKVIIPPIYDAVGEFRGGMAEVMVGGQPKKFSNGRVTALVGGLAGLIDRNGGTVIEPNFGRIAPMTSSVFIATKAQTGEPQSNNLSGVYLTVLSKTGVGLFHKTDGWLVEPGMFIRKFGNDMFWASMRKDNKLYGLMRTDGSWVIEPRFGYVQGLSEDGFAVVAATVDPSQTYRSGVSNNIWGAVDAEGRIAIPLEYEWLSYSKGGYFVARKGRKHGLLDHNNQLLGGRYFDRVERPKDGKRPRAFENGKWSGLTVSGKQTLDPVDRRVIGACPHVNITKHGDFYELRDPKSQLIGGKRVKYSGYGKLTISGDKKTYEFDCDQPIAFGDDVTMNYLLIDGTIMVENAPFKQARRFQKGHAVVQKGEKWGIINPTGKFTVEPIYDRLFGRNGIYRADVGEQTFWINASGDKVPKPQLTLKQRINGLACRGGAKRFSRNGFWGIKGAEDEVVIPPVHRAISCFRNGIAWAPDEATKQWCPLSPDGERPQRPLCITQYYPSQPTHTDPEKFDENPFESNVLWMRTKLDFASGQIDEAPRWVPWKNAVSHSRASP